MDVFVGIDLGSTTTKAVFIDKEGHIFGRGITNSRSNYHLACTIAEQQGEINSRLKILEGLLEARLATDPNKLTLAKDMMVFFESQLRFAEFLKQLEALHEQNLKLIDTWEHIDRKMEYRKATQRIFENIHGKIRSMFQPGSHAASDFFRDLAASLYLEEAEKAARETGLIFEKLATLFDRTILTVENQSFAVYLESFFDFAKEQTIKRHEFAPYQDELMRALKQCIGHKFTVLGRVGTGYGRLTLPFPKEQIRSEILCHGLGAHHLFPGTRTILDIGGQDTKAIQIDAKGIVTGFQMNDRCAAGCGRYLGYIADEMNMGVHELGPLARQSKKPARINSTCTVFAGAELRERLSLGEKREDILAGLHRAIILRAMSLLARSGGVFPEMTFTGGVARNEAAVAILKELVTENYGEIPMHISSDSIFTGALGAALFAQKGK